MSLKIVISDKFFSQYLLLQLRTRCTQNIISLRSRNIIIKAFAENAKTAYVGKYSTYQSIPVKNYNASLKCQLCCASLALNYKGTN